MRSSSPTVDAMARSLLHLATALLLFYSVTTTTVGGEDADKEIRPEKFRLWGPMGTFFDGKAFYNAVHYKLPSPIFRWTGPGKFEIREKFRNRVYPRGFVYAYGRLIGRDGLYFWRGQFKTLGDDFRVLPKEWFNIVGGGFYPKPGVIYKIYPKGFWWRGGGLHGPKGLFHMWDADTGKDVFYVPGPRVVKSWRFVWRNGGYYVGLGSRPVVLPLLKGDPGVPPGASIKKKDIVPMKKVGKKQPLPAKLPEGFQLVKRRLFGPYGVYKYGGVYRTFGDDYRILPDDWIWEAPNGIFYVRKPFIEKLYPKGYKWVNGGLQSPEGVWMKRVPWTLERRFYTTPGMRILPPKYFRWFKGGFVIKGRFHWVLKKRVPKGTSVVKKLALPAKLPKGFEFVKGRLFGYYGVYKYQGKYRTFGDDYRIVPTKWIWEAPNGIFYVKNQFISKLYPKKYKWINDGLQGPDGVWLKRVPWTLQGRFYAVPGFELVPNKYFRWVEGGFVVKDQFRKVVAKMTPKRNQQAQEANIHFNPRPGPHLEGTSIGPGSPAVVKKSPRPSVAIFPHTGDRDRFELINGKRYGDYNVVFDTKTKKLWTFGDRNNQLNPQWFTWNGDKFYVKKRYVSQLYPEQYKFDDDKGLVSPDRLYFQRVPGKSIGYFFFPGGAVLPEFYFYWEKGGFVMKDRFAGILLNG